MKREIINRLSIQRVLVFLYVIILAAGVLSSFNDYDAYMDVFAMPASGKIVIVDAGHGGWGCGYNS